MKFKILSAIGLSVLLLTGCVTTPTGQRQLDPQRTAAVIKTIVPPATRYAIAKEPQCRQWLVDVKVAICTLSESGKVTPDDLKTAVASTGINEIQTPESQAAIQAVYGIYEAYFADVTAQKLDQVQWLSPVLNAICDGLNDGLQPLTPATQ